MRAKGSALVWTINIVVLSLIALFFAWPFFGPNPLQHVKNILAAARTPDELLADVRCGAERFTVVHSDEADKGAVRTIDWQGYPASIRQVYRLTGYENDSIVLELPTRGAHWPPIYDSPTLPDSKVIATFVMDRVGFASMNQHSTGDLKNIAIIFTSDGGVSPDKVGLLAKCYAQHAKELNSAWQKEVVAFVAKGPDLPHTSEKREFVCSDTHTIVARPSFARLDDVPEKLIGRIGLNGELYVYRNDGEYVLATSSDLARWSSCKDSNGETFPQYIRSVASSTVFLESNL